jgi:hypothetical protein
MCSASSTAGSTKVGIGQRRDGKTEIVSGLQDGDLVVTAGQPAARWRSGIDFGAARGRVAPSPAPMSASPAASATAIRCPGGDGRPRLA